jgi:hypothetical protein
MRIGPLFASGWRQWVAANPGNLGDYDIHLGRADPVAGNVLPFSRNVGI